jgi:hypothetical protein
VDASVLLISINLAPPARAVSYIHPTHAALAAGSHWWAMRVQPFQRHFAFVPHGDEAAMKSEEQAGIHPVKGPDLLATSTALRASSLKTSFASSTPP